MLRLFSSRTSLLRKPLTRIPQGIPIRTMAAKANTNEELKVSKLFDVSHINAVVTGGGTGIGLMITQALVSNGAKVYITGRRPEALNAVVEQYNTEPGEIIALPGDISKKDEVQRLAKEVGSKEPKGIHLLVNNAGIARDDNTKYSNAKPDFSSAESISQHLLKSDPESWQETLNTNVTAQFFTSAAVSYFLISVPCLNDLIPACMLLTFLFSLNRISLQLETQLFNLVQ